MKKDALKAVIVSVSSDIGHALAKRFKSRGIDVCGTYRTPSAVVDDLENCGVKTVHCDVGNAASLHDACAQLRSTAGHWDYLILCPGTLEPVGAFADCDFDQWTRSLEVNFTRQIQLVHELLPSRNRLRGHPPVVLFFAGGGTNNATVNYSAYTISKIALIKMCELLDAEIPDTNFVVLGPGWVKTKIHQATLQAPHKAGDNYQKTIDKLASDACTPMEKILDCCDWVLQAERKLVSGRNFSVVFDKWGSASLTEQLLKDPHMYKLRRQGNDWKGQ
jgi:NAD(P)-dependent dehydrogenase (short-subunit alcohol dehydrogenase family)